MTGGLREGRIKRREPGATGGRALKRPGGRGFSRNPTLARGKHKKHARTKRVQGKRLWRRLPRSAWISIAVVLAVAGVLAGIYGVGRSSPGYAGPPRAAIVDQLSVMLVNEEFLTEVTTELEEFGFEVDLYQGEEVDVKLYRELPARGYKLIIFRAHSGLVGEGEEVHVQTLIFTNESFSMARHWSDLFAGRLHMATVGEGYPEVFGIPREFITDGMEGEFDDTIVIMMGCSGIYIPDLAMGFIDNGALAYLAWNATVDLDYVDKATPYLIRQLCSEGLTIQEAVANTMAHIGPDPTYEAELKYYPARRGDSRLERPAQEAPADPDDPPP